MAYLAKGDMPLSIMMTTASTLAAIVTTPVLTSLLVGTLVPVNATAMFLSVLQLVLAPVLVGCCMNQFFPDAVARIKVYTPFLATLVGAVRYACVGMVLLRAGVHGVFQPARTKALSMFVTALSGACMVCVSIMIPSWHIYIFG